MLLMMMVNAISKGKTTDRQTRPKTGGQLKKEKEREKWKMMTTTTVAATVVSVKINGLLLLVFFCLNRKQDRTRNLAPDKLVIVKNFINK